MSDSFDLNAALNKPSADKIGVALNKRAVGKAERLKLTPTQEKEKAVKGKLFLREETETYKLGKPERPVYMHDNGHLGAQGEELKPLRAPTEADKKMQRVMFARLQVAESMCNDRENKKDWWWQNRQRFVNECGGGNQPDANLAFRNFLFGKGKSRTVDYERYLRDEDSKGAMAPGTHKVVRMLINDFMAHAEAIGFNRQKFGLTSTQMYAIGKDGFADGPQDWNWRRTLGDHVIWISADVTAAAAPKGTHIVYTADLTFHIEDMYNFNPGKSDGQLKINDSEGGMLELSGLAKQFMTFATIYRHIEWDEKVPVSVKVTKGAPPPGAILFIEDHAKEEAELKRAQSEAGVGTSLPELWEMATKFYDRQFHGK